jgi:hypothetical protein
VCGVGEYIDGIVVSATASPFQLCDRALIFRRFFCMGTSVSSCYTIPLRDSPFRTFGIMNEINGLIPFLKKWEHLRKTHRHVVCFHCRKSKRN